MAKHVRLDFHQGTLRLSGLDRVLVEKLKQLIPLVFDDRDDCHRCDAYHFNQLKHAIGRSDTGGCQTSIGDDFALSIPDLRKIKLRHDQRAAVDAWNDHAGRGLVVMPTGTGKTVVALDTMLHSKQSTLIVVPVRDLMYQWHTKIWQSTGVDAGLIGDGVHRVSPISVTTYDSAAIHAPRIGQRFGMVIFDEVHHLAGRWRRDAARMIVAPLRLGLTATLPHDSQRRELLEQLVGPVVFEQSVSQAKGKTLAEYSVRRIAVQLTEQERESYQTYGKTIQSFVQDQREIDSRFQWKDTHQIVANASVDPEIAKRAATAIHAFRAKRKIEEHASGKMRVLEDLFRLHAGERVLVFAGSNVMARKISLRFLAPCLLSHCAKRERRDLLEGFAEGRYPVLIANRVLDEGVDLPEVKIAIVVGGMSSQRQAIQRLGRVLRRDASGNQALLYEVVTDQTREVQRSRDRRRNDAYRSG